MKMKMFWEKHGALNALKVKKRQVVMVKVQMRVTAVIQNMHNRQLKEVTTPEVEGMPQALCFISRYPILLT